RWAPLGVVRLTLSWALHRGRATASTPGHGGISPLAHSAIAAPEPIAASRVSPDPPWSCPARSLVSADDPGASLKPVRSLVKQERQDHLLTTGRCWPDDAGRRATPTPRRRGLHPTRRSSARGVHRPPEAVVDGLAGAGPATSRGRE